MAKKINVLKAIGKKKPVVLPPDPVVVLPPPDAEEPVALPVLPVESDKPGVARHPRQKKVEPEIKHDSVLSKHLHLLLKRLASQNGGDHAKALADFEHDTLS